MQEGRGTLRRDGDSHPNLAQISEDEAKLLFAIRKRRVGRRRGERWRRPRLKREAAN
jgi:hypothetical protein